MNTTHTVKVGFENITDKKQQKKAFGFCMTPIDENLNPYGLTVDEEELINLADDMASAMTNLNSQNYKSFIVAREQFRAKIKEIVNQIRSNEERIAEIKKFAANI